MSDDEYVLQVRRQISDLDRALVELVNKRLKLVAGLKRYKDEHGIGFVVAGQSLVGTHDPSGRVRPEPVDVANPIGDVGTQVGQPLPGRPHLLAGRRHPLHSHAPGQLRSDPFDGGWPAAVSPAAGAKP